MDRARGLQPHGGGRCVPRLVAGQGAGESATVGAPPAIANAVVDALRHLGVTHIDIRITAVGVAEEKTGLTSKALVFAGGDAVTGTAIVILAAGAGKRAAQAIHEALASPQQ